MNIFLSRPKGLSLATAAARTERESMVNKARVFFPDTMIKVNITFASKAKILPLEFSKGYQLYKSSFYLSLSFFQNDLFCQRKLYRIDRLYKTLKVGADPYSQIEYQP